MRLSLRKQAGASATEYAIVVAVIVLAVVAAGAILDPALRAVFTNVAATITANT